MGKMYVDHVKNNEASQKPKGIWQPVWEKVLAIG